MDSALNYNINLLKEKISDCQKLSTVIEAQSGSFNKDNNHNRKVILISQIRKNLEDTQRLINKFKSDIYP